MLEPKGFAFGVDGIAPNAVFWVVEPNPVFWFVDEPNADEPKPELWLVEPNALDVFWEEDPNGLLAGLLTLPKPPCEVLEPNGFELLLWFVDEPNALEPNPDVWLVEEPNADEPKPELVPEPKALLPNPELWFEEVADPNGFGFGLEKAELDWALLVPNDDPKVGFELPNKLLELDCDDFPADCSTFDWNDLPGTVKKLNLCLDSVGR